MTKKKDKNRDYERMVQEESLILEATELIEEILEKTGLNRKELADKLGRSKGFITQILSGDRNMTLRTLAAFAFALDHRVSVAASPLAASGDGGEAKPGLRPAMTRVYAGSGDFIAQTKRSAGSDDSRRHRAAEGVASGRRTGGVRSNFLNARTGGERPDLVQLGTFEPLESTEEQAPVVG
jgi:transcriptional regulator with XRE-family HTH domain